MAEAVRFEPLSIPNTFQLTVCVGRLRLLLIHNCATNTTVNLSHLGLCRLFK